MSIASDVLLKETVARVEALERQLLELKANLLNQKPAETDQRGVYGGQKKFGRQQ